MAARFQWYITFHVSFNTTKSDISLKCNKVLANVSDIYKAQVFPFDDASEHALYSISEESDITSQCNSVENNDKKFDLENSELPDTKARLQSFLSKHRGKFSTDLSELGKTSVRKHETEIKPRSKSDRLQFHRTSFQDGKEIARQIEEMENMASSNLSILNDTLLSFWHAKRMALSVLRVIIERLINLK